MEDDTKEVYEMFEVDRQTRKLSSEGTVGDKLLILFTKVLDFSIKSIKGL
jgi:hypothetical protein